MPVHSSLGLVPVYTLQGSTLEKRSKLGDKHTIVDIKYRGGDEITRLLFANTFLGEFMCSQDSSFRYQKVLHWAIIAMSTNQTATGHVFAAR